MLYLFPVFKLFQMATRHSSEKTFLGEPESVLAREWLEAYHGGGEHGDKIPWDFKNRVKLPTHKQVRLKVASIMRSHPVFFSILLYT